VSFGLFVAPLAGVAAPVATAAGTGVQVAQSAGKQNASTISGTVKNAAGQALTSVKVSLTGPLSASMLTGPDGTFQFTALPAGSYLVTIEKSPFATINTTISVAQGVTQTTAITLEPQTQTTLRRIGRVVVARKSTQINTTAVATSTLTNQDYIQRGQTQVQNLLEELPGVELQRFSSGGAPGANTNVALRGADPKETQVLIDGHPITGGRFGTYLVQFLNPLLLGDVEVDKGPATLGYQIANQVNGTVNFRTPSITQTPSANIDVGYDTYNGSSYATRVSDTFGKIGLLAGYAFFGTPGYNTQPVLSVVPDGNPAPGQPADATITTAFGASQTYNNRTEVLKLAYDFSPSTAVTFGYLGMHAYVDYTGTLTTEEPFKIIGSCPNPASLMGNAPASPGTGTGCGFVSGNSGLPTYTNPVYAGLIGHTVFASSTLDNLYLGNFETDNEPLFTGDFRTTIGPGSLLARYYASSINRSISDPTEAFQQLQCDDPACSFAMSQANGDVSNPFFQRELDILHGGDFDYELPVGPNTYAVSFDSHSDRSTYGTGTDPSKLSYGVPAILQTSTTVSARGNLRFGSRFDAIVGNYFSNTTFLGSRYDPRIGFTYQPNANASIRFSSGSAYVTPSALDAYNLIPHASHHNLNEGPGVKPETSVSYDLGTDIQTTSDSKISFDAYITRLFNRFASYDDRLSTPILFGSSRINNIHVSFNSGTALEKGLELTYTKAPRIGLGAMVDFNLLRAYGSGDNYALNNISPAGIYGNTLDGNQFPGYPFSHGRLELNYMTKNAVRPEVGLTYYGQLNSFGEPGFALFDAGVDAKLTSGFHLIANISNIFNHDSYRTFGVYGFGNIDPGNSTPDTLFFAPPRSITLQLQKQIGSGPSQ